MNEHERKKKRRHERAENVADVVADGAELIASGLLGLLVRGGGGLLRGLGKVFDGDLNPFS